MACPPLPFRPGDAVEVFGLTSESGQQLNGENGVVVRYVEESQRFEIRFSPDKYVNLKPNNLMKLHGTPTSVGAEEWAAGVLRPGDNVECYDLASDTGQELNGRSGVVVKHIEGTDRFEVRFVLGDPSSAPKLVRLKTCNLKKVGPPIYVGDVVDVSGLTSEAGRLLNGQRGVVTRCGMDQGRVEVRLPKGKVSLVKPSNLTKLVAINDLVEVCDLESDSGRSLNGWKGTVTQYFEDTGRFEVKLPPRKLVSLRFENLRRVDVEQFENYPGRYD